MIRQDGNRIAADRRNVIDHRNNKFVPVTAKKQGTTSYPHRLNFYSEPPTDDITLEEFEQWAIDRLRVLSEVEACAFRNRTAEETAMHMKAILEKRLHLQSNSSRSGDLAEKRRTDHYGHFILRLAFARTEDLRRRFARLETALFRLRWATDNPAERAEFVRGLELDWWEPVGEAERAGLAAELGAVMAGGWSSAKTAGPRGKEAVEDESGPAWFKVDWERVPDLVEARRVLLRGGRAYVPEREQMSMVAAEFSARLEKQLELTARALPRLDEDDRLAPILDHLAKSFVTPDASYTGSSSAAAAALPGGAVTADSIDGLASAHFPACMSHLHRSLRRDAHLKHYGRLQYTLFLKAVGLPLDEALAFWRRAFHRVTDDTFNKEYRYNVRHAYGDVGGDANRRGGGYGPLSCQRILTEHPPGPGEAHGCPYRHFGAENLTSLLAAMGVTERGVVQGVREDKDKMKFHLACNRVFEHLHKTEIKTAKDREIMSAAQLETIVHPNEYFKRSWLLKNLERRAEEKAGGGVKMEE